jgi:hypothetical protein
MVAELAHAADQPISLKRVVLRRSSSGAESLVIISKDPNFLFPAIGGADDPTQPGGGATLELLTPSGTSATLVMPAGDGAPGWTASDGAIDRYRFRNDGAPDGFSSVRAVLLRDGKVLRITGPEVGLPLDASLGRLIVRLTTGSLRSCGALGVLSIVRDAPGNFVARDAAPPVAADCSDVSLGLPGCGNGMQELAEQCDGNDAASCPTGNCLPDCTCDPAVCGDGVRQGSEPCDGSDAPSCPGQCLPDCTCPPTCGDGIVNQPSEQCDAPSETAYCPSDYFACRSDCTCCSPNGLFCDAFGCCDPLRSCIPGPSGQGYCHKVLCPPSSPSCDPPFVCQTFEGPGGVTVDACCEPRVNQGCGWFGVGPGCCNGLVCDNPTGIGGRCCVPVGGACADATECCSNTCTANVCE